MFNLYEDEQLPRLNMAAKPVRLPASIKHTANMCMFVSNPTAFYITAQRIKVIMLCF